MSKAVLTGALRFALMALVAATAMPRSLPAQQAPGRELPRPLDRDTEDDWSRRLGRPDQEQWQVLRDPIADGEPISYRQDPPILTAAHRGPVALSEVVIAGDTPELRFRRNNPFGDDPVETWARVRTATVAGRLVSVFTAAWPEEVFATTLSVLPVGPDFPIVFWGTLLRPGSDSGSFVYLRIASTALPASQVTRINDTVQFASHVVNLVMPEFAARRVEGGVEEMDERGAAKRFYEHFRDAYDVLSFVSEPAAFLDENAYHRTVRNEVTGINANVIDQSAGYGSAGALHGIDTFRDAQVLTPRLTNHELSHQWGHYFDWGRLAGLQRVWPDTVHTPVVSPGQSLIGAKLYPIWRVVRTDAGEYRLGLTPGPIEAGPFELYAMGLLAAEDLPDLTVFADQEQFVDGRTIPRDGALVLGASRTVSGRDLLGLYGRRGGPVPQIWRRALVVVSRDALLSQREMDYWNFHAARIEDPNGASPVAYEGYVSLDRATRRAVDLQTRIEPKVVLQIPQSFDLDYPPIAATDCRGVEFRAPVARRYTVGQRFRIEGTVTARDQANFDQLIIRFWPYGGATSRVVQQQVEVGRGGDFRLDFEFRAGQEGQTLFEVFLFWPGAPAQFARCTLSPVTIFATP